MSSTFIVSHFRSFMSSNSTVSLLAAGGTTYGFHARTSTMSNCHVHCLCLIGSCPDKFQLAWIWQRYFDFNQALARHDFCCVCRPDLLGAEVLQRFLQFFWLKIFHLFWEISHLANLKACARVRDKASWAGTPALFVVGDHFRTNIKWIQEH